MSKLRQNSSSFLATKHIVKHAFLEHMKTNDVQPRAGSRVLNVGGCDFVGKLHWEQNHNFTALFSWAKARDLK